MSAQWRDLVPKLLAAPDGVRLRVGTVARVDADGDALVVFAGADLDGDPSDPVPIPALAGYAPAAGHVVACLIDSSRGLILGRLTP